MVANQRFVEKEIGQLLQMTVASPDDWYEVTGGVGLDNNVRHNFNDAFECLIAGSYDSAFKGFARLSNRGSVVSQYHLGLMYLKGMGVLQDFCRAHLWFNIASSQGNKKARVQLGRLTEEMSAHQVAEAQKLARAWVAKNRRRN